MVKKILATSLVVAVLVLSGCGNSDAESRLKAQQALDEGDYSTAIASLESKTLKTDEDNMLLASSYMGKAGFSLSDTISIVGKNTTTDAFASFSSNVSDGKNPGSLDDLQQAIFYYGSIAGATNKASSRASSNSVTAVGDRDLFLGLANLMKATVSLSYLGDVSKLKSDVAVDENLLASACAIVSVYSPSSTLPTGCVQVLKTPEGEYTKLSVILNGAGGKVFYRLANKAATEVILTDYDAKVLKALKVKAADVTITDVLVDTINNAFSLIEKIAPEDVKDDIVKFKNEIGLVNGRVTAETLAKYISTK